MSVSKFYYTQQCRTILKCEDASLRSYKQKHMTEAPKSDKNPPNVLQLFCSSWNSVSIATSLYFNEEVMTDSRSNSHVWLPKYCFSHLPFEWKWRRKESQPTWLSSRQFISKQFVTQANAVRKKKSGRVCLSARNTFHTIYIISSLTCMADHFWLSGLVISIFPELFTNEDDLQCLKAIGIFNQLILIHNGFFCENITKVMNKLYKWTPVALSLCIEEERE